MSKICWPTYRDTAIYTYIYIERDTVTEVTQCHSGGTVVEVVQFCGVVSGLWNTRGRRDAK